ncbi:MAG: hypothetical protein AAF636_18450 [Pseudomonadota bacterium]
MGSSGPISALAQRNERVHELLFVLTDNGRASVTFRVVEFETGLPAGTHRLNGAENFVRGIPAEMLLRQSYCHQPGIGAWRRKSLPEIPRYVENSPFRPVETDMLQQKIPLADYSVTACALLTPVHLGLDPGNIAAAVTIAD